MIRIAQNLVEKLQHGWFAVRNRSPSEIKAGVSMKDRHATEREFFMTSPWSELRKDRIGIPALSTFLAQLLYEHIRREFPAVVDEIEKHCKQLLADIEDLGPPRQSTIEQRQYLTQVASRYQKKLADYLRGVYDADLPSDHPLKLRMHIRDLNDAFAKKMSKQGHTRAFRNTDDEEDSEYHFKSSEKSSIYDWIRTSYLEARGSELPGCVNPAVLENLFRQQTFKWQEIAEQHLEKVQSSIQDFLIAIIEALIVDTTVQDRLRGRLVPLLDDSAGQAYHTLGLFLKDEREGILQTVNHYFADTLAAAREERVVSRLRKLGVDDDNLAYSVNLASLTKATHLSNEDQAIYSIHDILKAYYKVAIKRFMDNVVVGVVERSWLGPHGFVAIFDGEFVGNLSDDELGAIAAENYSTTTMRIDLQEKLGRFEEARRIAKTV